MPRIPPEKVAPRLDRWRAIAREAAEQSGRTRVPSVDGVIPFKEALARAKGGVGLIAWEEESELLLSSELSRLLDAGAVTLFIGPEGGFSAEEVAEARKGGVISVSLGPRTLRTETAAIAASALIIYTLENL